MSTSVGCVSGSEAFDQLSTSTYGCRRTKAIANAQLVDECLPKQTLDKARQDKCVKPVLVLGRVAISALQR